MVAAVTTASAGGEDERVRKGSRPGRPQAGQGGQGWRVGGQGERREEGSRAETRRRDVAGLRGHSVPGGGGG